MVLRMGSEISPHQVFLIFLFARAVFNYIFGTATQDEIEENNWRVISTKKFNVRFIESKRQLAFIKPQDIKITDSQKTKFKCKC